jgi:lipoyl(octanoyl) transferase
VPCCISEFPVTSIAALGGDTSMATLDAALKAHFPAFLNRLARCGTGVEQCETGG